MPMKIRTCIYCDSSVYLAENLRYKCPQCGKNLKDTETKTQDFYTESDMQKVRAEERERCAVVCEDLEEIWSDARFSESIRQMEDK